MHQPVLPEGVDGDRRRPEGLLLSIMSHVSERIEEVEKRHEERYKALDMKISNLTDSINSYIDKEPAAILERCEEMIDELIPTHPENEDASMQETKVMREDDESRELWRKVREWGVIGLLGVIALALWQFILKGPQ